jgi:RNA polymerase sigma factor (sigma-70 family)
MPIAPTDAELIADVRAGGSDAYDVLYRRHADAARGLAWRLTGSGADADDLVADAFMTVLASLRRGRGPDVAFRAYLFTTLRNAHISRSRVTRRMLPVEDMTRLDPGEPWTDPVLAELELALASRAYARLPERWRLVLWHTAVGRETPAGIGARLGMTANGVAALAYRAREGLRQAYLQEHVGAAEHPDTAGRLGAWARGRLPPAQRTAVDAHLDGCGGCRSLADELTAVNGQLRGSPRASARPASGRPPAAPAPRRS